MSLSKALTRLHVSVVLVAVTVLGGSAATVAGEPGGLDRTFGRDGVRYIDFGRGEYAQILSVDEAGRLQLAGVWDGDPEGGDNVYKLALTRLASSGSVDRSFGNDGKVLFDPTERGYDPPHAWAQAPGDRLVALGSNGNDGIYLARFRGNGSIDRELGGSGLVLDSPADDVVYTLNLAVQPSGRILTLSRTNTGSLITAYRPAGPKARGFGRNGSVRIHRNFSGRGSLVSRPDGRILVAGRRNRILGSEPNPKLIIHGLLPDGAPDVAFGREGRAAMPIDIPNAELQINAATVLPSGKVVVAGQIGSFSSDAYVARFSADGDVDTSFGGGDGWRRFDLGPIDASNAIVQLPGKRLAIIGYIGNDLFGDRPASHSFVAALRQDGRFWKRFGDGGVVKEDFGLGRDDSVVAADGAVVDGKLIVVGGARGDMFAARYFLSRHQ